MVKNPSHTHASQSATTLSRGNIAFRGGKYAEAIAHYEEALKQVPELEKIIATNLAQARKKLKKTDVAAKDLSDVLTLNQQLAEVSQTDPVKKIAVVVHYFYPDIWKEIKEKLTALPPIFDLFVTVPSEIAETAIRDVLAAFPSVRIQVGKNIGMDIVPFLSLIPTLANEGYYAVCKLQTKKGDGHLAAIWRQVMLDSLIGSRHNFTRAIDAFLGNENLCLIGPAALYQSGQRLMYDNAQNLSTILETSYGTKLPEEDWGFFAGTMFWSRIDILEKLARIANFTHSALDGEYKKDGKLEHALERIFGLLPMLHNGKVGLLQPKRCKHDACEVLVCDPRNSIGHAHIGDVMRQLARIDGDKDLIEKSGYFSDHYYIAQNPELVGIEIDLVYHYLTQGSFRGKQPCENFSTFGQVSSYLKEKGDERNPLLFFIEHGGDNIKIAQHIERNSYKRSSVFDKVLVEKTGLFDKEFYCRQCPDVLKAGENPLDHYFSQGTFNEIYPNQYFIPREYRALHSDVVNAGIEPFYHYLTAGALEGRRYRATQWREEDETPFFRYMVLNVTLIDWPNLVDRKTVAGMVSIVIPIYGHIQLTEECVNSILAVTTSQNYEIVCVDNGSGKGMSELLTKLSARDKRIKYIQNRDNYNFSLGCNVGFQASVGEYIVFLNNDTTVTDNWLDELVQPLINDERIVAVQPKLIYPDRSIQNVGVVFAPKQTLGYPIYVNSSADESCVNISRDYQAITAACMAIRAKDFAKAKGFDPIFINGQEDIDLCLRLTHGTDRVCRYQASSVVVHHESKTPGRGKYIKLNRKNFTERWRNRVEPDDFKYYADDKFKIVKWNKDNDEMVKAGLGISRPTLEKVKISPVHFFWDSGKERLIKERICDIYSECNTIFKAKLVSVVMPTFNRSKVIEKAIQSVLQQSHQNFELHICDDGSTDETQNIIARYLSDPRIKFHQLNHSGVSTARNKGLESSRGELVAYLDSDNTWDKDFLKTMLVVVYKGELDAAYCAIHATDDNGKTICYRGDIFDWSECLKDNYIDMNAFVHTPTNARFDETLKRLVDWDFILRVTKQSRVAYIPYVGVNYYDGNQFLRITQNEYIGDKLAEMQGFIRKKHNCAESGSASGNNVGVEIESFLPLDNKIKYAISTTHSVEREISETRRLLRFRIKIGCPNLAVSHEWGDYHFANAMKRSLQKFGHQCEVDCLDQWESADSLAADIVIVLRGLSRYKPKQGQLNLMWNISHPDKICLDEYAEYDHVFIASIPYAKQLQKKVTVPISALLQCTDPELFNPCVPKKRRHEVLFVGNSRNVYRKIVKDAIQADLPLSVFGTRWEQFIPKQYIAGEHINNEELAGYYANAGIVLNDHWDTMRKYGFLSNRLFDAAACAALVVTDDIEGLRDVFDDTILTYNSPEKLREIYFGFSTHHVSAQRINLANKIISHHSFDARVQSVLCIVNNLLSGKELLHV